MRLILFTDEVGIHLLDPVCPDAAKLLVAASALVHVQIMQLLLSLVSGER